jgi:hypothetical protein
VRSRNLKNGKALAHWGLLRQNQTKLFVRNTQVPDTFSQPVSEQNGVRCRSLAVTVSPPATIARIQPTLSSYLSDHLRIVGMNARVPRNFQEFEQGVHRLLQCTFETSKTQGTSRNISFIIVRFEFNI